MSLGEPQFPREPFWWEFYPMLLPNIIVLTPIVFMIVLIIILI